MRRKGKNLPIKHALVTVYAGIQLFQISEKMRSMYKNFSAVVCKFYLFLQIKSPFLMGNLSSGRVEKL